MTMTKEINASDWTGKTITIEVLDGLSFRFYDYTITLVQKSNDEIGASYAIMTNDHEGSIGTVYALPRPFGTEYVATACGIEREGDDLLTVTAQLLANTL
jgi:hypothetical protein